jgi:hypothetical protein
MMKLWTLLSLVFVLIQQHGDTHRPPDLIVRLVYLDNGKPADNQQIVLYEGSPSQASTSRKLQLFDGQQSQTRMVSPNFTFQNLFLRRFGLITTTDTSEAVHGRTRFRCRKYSRKV